MISCTSAQLVLRHLQDKKMVKKAYDDNYREQLRFLVEACTEEPNAGADMCSGENIHRVFQQGDVGY